MEIPVNQGKVVTVDDTDWPLISIYHWTVHKHRHTWYATTAIKNNDGTTTTVKMHRLLLGAKTGEQVDHIDGNGLNNKRHNIRIVTHAQNQRNQHATRAKSGSMGVYLTKTGKFQASVKRNNRLLYLGIFPNVALAAKARKDFIARECA